MDATRPRRRKDPNRQLWYAQHRQRRFARHFGFLPIASGSTDDSRSHNQTGKPTNTQDNVN
ncbi:hypothetical protein BH23PLA1_BH23PLA1_00280 [soil metagenome]